MNDCINADIRDQLPELLHGRLDASARQRVEAHLAGCADCAAELHLLRGMHRMMHAAPSLNVGALAQSIPAYRVAAPSWRRWAMAAGVVVVAGGAALIGLVQRAPAHAPLASVSQLPPSAPVQVIRPSAPAVAPVPMPDSEPRTRVATNVESPAVQAPARELALGGSALNDLSDSELTALLKAIDGLDAVPSADVESGSLSPAVPRRSMQ